jgi:hypothetical protein
MSGGDDEAHALGREVACSPSSPHDHRAAQPPALGEGSSRRGLALRRLGLGPCPGHPGIAYSAPMSGPPFARLPHHDRGLPPQRTGEDGRTSDLIFVRDHASFLDYKVNWAAWLGSDTIRESIWSTEPGISITNPSHSDTETTIWVSAGVPGLDYGLVNRILTDGGRTAERVIVIHVCD